MKKRNRSTQFKANGANDDAANQVPESVDEIPADAGVEEERQPDEDLLAHDALGSDLPEEFEKAMDAFEHEGEVSAEEADVDKLDEGGLPEVASGYLPYGESLESGPEPEEFNELTAMNELLSQEGEYGALPHPDVFNAYPPEVQRKIMEWTDRDVKARRDDESRRKDELVRATIERNRRKQVIPAIIVVVAVLCGAIVGFATGNPVFTIAFLFVPIAVIVAVFVSENVSKNRHDGYRLPSSRKNEDKK